jgi:hypothetical protein
VIRSSDAGGSLGSSPTHLPLDLPVKGEGEKFFDILGIKVVIPR